MPRLRQHRAARFYLSFTSRHMAVHFEQVSRIIVEQAEDVVQVFNRALWLDAYSANREFVFSFAPLGEDPPFDIFAEARFRWDVNLLAMSMEPRPVDEEGNVDEPYLDLEVSVFLPPLSALPEMAEMRTLITSLLPQYNPPLFNLTHDYNIEAPGETVYHLKLDYMWSFDGEARILTTRYADIFHDLGRLIQELNRARGGWQTAHFS